MFYMFESKINELERVVASRYSNITGIVVLKDGENIYEQYFNGCNMESKIHVYSVSKSILSILIGIAIEQGYIKSINQKIYDFFPEYRSKKHDPTVSNVTLRDMLTMTVPYKYKESPLIYMRYFMSKDWVSFSLNQLNNKHANGSFRYTPLIGPDILSGIITRATGKSVLEFAKEVLFLPLNITIGDAIVLRSAKAQADFNKSTLMNGWVTDSRGINSGGWGLTLSTIDMAKIGQLYIDNGFFDGKYVVSKTWTDASTQPHSYWEEENLSYGYLWWIISEADQSFAAMGDGGNIIYVNRKKNTVIAITSLYRKGVVDRISFINQYVQPLSDAVSLELI